LTSTTSALITGEPVQLAGGVEAGEAGADDHDSGSRHPPSLPDGEPLKRTFRTLG
jgi:hypothetical protein